MTDDDDSTTDADSRLRNIPWWRIANVVGLILLVAIVVPFVVFIFPQVVGASQSYVVLSGSMEPVMSPGDAVIVDDVPAEQIEQGDIITYRASDDDRPTTHRVIEVTQQGDSPAFQTKGDANEDPDSSLVTPGQVQGQVMSVDGHLFVIPYIGHVINFAGTQTGFILIFAVPVTLLMLNEVWNLIVASRADTDAGSEAGSGSTAAEPDTSDAAGSDAEAAEGGVATAETGSAESSDGGITFSAAELQLGLVVLAAFLAYSVWVAYQTLETWSFGVAGGVASAFLLLAGLYFFGGASGDATDGGAPDAPPSGTEAEADPDSDSDGESEPGPEPEPASAESQVIDPDVELNLLKDAVDQGADGGGSDTPPPVAGGPEQHASDGGTPSIAADDREESGSEDPDRTADDTGGQDEGETDD